MGKASGGGARTQAQLERQRDLREVRRLERAARALQKQEADLNARHQALEGALRDSGRGNLHNGRYVRRLEDIVDDTERLQILKARVERLEAIWRVRQRQHELRGKIVVGEALVAELRACRQAEDQTLRAFVRDVVDRRVLGVRDRFIIRWLLDDAALPLRPGGSATEPAAIAFRTAAVEMPDFDAEVEAAMRLGTRSDDR